MMGMGGGGGGGGAGGAGGGMSGGMWGGVVGTIMAIAGGKSGARSARQAGATQAAGYEKGVEARRDQFADTTGYLAPYRGAGEAAIGQQQALLGLSGDQAQRQAYSQFGDSPGQQFLRNRQEQALLRNASAIGGLGGGNIRAELQRQATGNAAQEYDNYYNQLAGLSGGGLQASTALGQFGESAATGIQSGLQGEATSLASGILAKAQAKAKMFEGISSSFGSMG